MPAGPRVRGFFAAATRAGQPCTPPLSPGSDPHWMVTTPPPLARTETVTDGEKDGKVAVADKLGVATLGTWSCSVTSSIGSV